MCDINPNGPAIQVEPLTDPFAETELQPGVYRRGTGIRIDVREALAAAGREMTGEAVAEYLREVERACAEQGLTAQEVHIRPTS